MVGENEESKTAESSPALNESNKQKKSKTNHWKYAALAIPATVFTGALAAPIVYGVYKYDKSQRKKKRGHNGPSEEEITKPDAWKYFTAGMSASLLLQPAGLVVAAIYAYQRYKYEKYKKNQHLANQTQSVTGNNTETPLQQEGRSYSSFLPTQDRSLPPPRQELMRDIDKLLKQEKTNNSPPPLGDRSLSHITEGLRSLPDQENSHLPPTRNVERSAPPQGTPRGNFKRSSLSDKELASLNEVRNQLSESQSTPKKSTAAEIPLKGKVENEATKLFEAIRSNSITKTGSQPPSQSAQRNSQKTPTQNRGRSNSF
ncbi:MAG: hypothetical protein K0Q51_8 [Rickettsiaceae bacterium]|jgi:hypothetical protein|nr:hypothetical protein [Rickettsiaceae bacterium]